MHLLFDIPSIINNKFVNIYEFQVLSKQEERVKQRFLQQPDSLIAEKEQLRVQGFFPCGEAVISGRGFYSLERGSFP